MKRSYSFLSLPAALVLLRVTVAGIFLAHAGVRVATGTIARFGGFLENKGFIYGNAIVWTITAFELIGGALMAAGYFTRWIATGFILMLIAGIFIIHIHEGWFNGEFGTGGCEYSVTLIAALIVIVAAGKK